MQTRLIAALHAVKVKGCADYVDTAAEADDEREALFFVESAEWLAGMHKTEPVSALLSDARAIVAKTRTGAVALLPVDWVRWKEDVQKATTDLATRARRELGATALEMRISGTATAAAKAGLRAEGWTVKEHVVVATSLSAPATRSTSQAVTWCTPVCVSAKVRDGGAGARRRRPAELRREIGGVSVNRGVRLERPRRGDAHRPPGGAVEDRAGATGSPGDARRQG